MERIETLARAFERGDIGRREFVRGVTLAVAGTAAGPAAAVGARTAVGSSRIRAVSLNHVTLAVSDVDAAQAFYERVLGVSEVSRQFNGVNLGLGDSFLGLYDIDPPPRIHHFCVGVEDFDIEQKAAELRSLGVEPSIRQDRPELYFTDADGITVQLSDPEYRG